MYELLSYLRELNIHSLLLRLALAVFVGGMVGLEREMKRRPAGFRTYMLVSLGAALTMILGQYYDLMLNTQWQGVAARLGNRVDVVRFGAQVINGVGFLGAGTIIVTGHQQVKGLTTAAGLWASACMGLAIGAGFYECVFVGFALIVFSMKLLPGIERAILSGARNVNVYIEMDNIEIFGNVVTRLKAEGLSLYDMEIEKQQQESGSQINALFSLRMPKKMQHAEVLATLSTIDGIRSIEEL